MPTAALALSAYAVDCSSSVVLLGSTNHQPKLHCAGTGEACAITFRYESSTLIGGVSESHSADLSRKRLSSFLRCRLCTRRSRDGRGQRCPGYRRAIL